MEVVGFHRNDLTPDSACAHRHDDRNGAVVETKRSCSAGGWNSRSELGLPAHIFREKFLYAQCHSVPRSLPVQATKNRRYFAQKRKGELPMQ